MINLELTEEEALDLVMLLGLHSLSSDLKTYPVFSKLCDILDPEGTDGRFSAYSFTRLLERTSIKNGLFTVNPKT